MLVPLLGPVPSYLPYFIASAARASPLADFLIFHERTSTARRSSNHHDAHHDAHHAARTPHTPRATRHPPP